tara:strand:- start:49 stop:246 length:198 start_codon:yes stop_codon:yes gene_type:complete
MSALSNASALRELKTPASLATAVFFSFHYPCVPGEKTLFFEDWAERRLIEGQSLGDPVPHSAGLA